MENFKETGRLSRRFSSRKSLGSLKTRFKRFLSDHHARAREAEDQAKAGEVEDTFSCTGSDSDTDGRQTSSPPPDKSVEIKQASCSGSSSDSDEESPSKMDKKKRSDASSDSSEEKKKSPLKFNRKNVQSDAPQGHEDLVRLPSLEETPPTSPRSNPRFSTGAQSDYGRLWTHASAPNSPANLTHNLNISYRGGDSSPVALVHSLSIKERGKHPSQLSETFYASPPNSSSLDFDVLGVKLEDMTASPSKTSPSLDWNELPIVRHDEEQGVWRCGRCGWIYPHPNPSSRNRREHKKHCGEFSNVQRWLGAQDTQDARAKGAVELVEDSEVLEGSGSRETLRTADKHPMESLVGKNYDEDVSHRSADHFTSVGHDRLDDIVSNGLPDHDAIGDEGNGWRSPSAVANPDEVEDEELNRVIELPTLDTGRKDQSSTDEMLSNGSANHHEVTDHCNLKDVSYGSIAHYGSEEGTKLDDSASFITPEVENEEEERVEVKADQEEVICSVESSQGFASEVESHETHVNQKSLEEMENEVGHVQVPSVNDNRKHSCGVVHSGHGLVHVENVNQGLNGHLNRSDEIGHTDVSEVQSGRSVLPGDAGVEDIGSTSSIESSLVIGSETKAHESQLKQKWKEETENEVGDVQVPPVNGNGNHSFGVVHSNGHVSGDIERANLNNQGFNDNLNHLDEMGLTDVPEVHREHSVLTSDTGVWDGQVKNDLDSQIPGDDGFSKETVPSDAIEKTEPKVIMHKGRSIVLAEAVREPDVMEPSLSKAEFQSLETEIETRDVKTLKAVGRDVTNVDKVTQKLTESPHSQYGHRIGRDAMTDGFVSDHSSEQKSSESDSVGGRSSRDLHSQENGASTDYGERAGGPPSPLEEAPKWMNNVMITSQDEGDTFTSVQKYWADVTRSEFLLVEGKRSPSFGSRETIGFPSFRNGEGRRSPSPFSLSKSREGELQSSPSVLSVDYGSTVEDKSEEGAIPRLTLIHHVGSSSSSAHVDYDLEQVVHEQSTHDLFCPVCGSDVTKRIILKKRKRTLVLEDDGREAKAIMTQSGRRVEGLAPQIDESDDETWGCLGCLSFFILRGGGKRLVSQDLVPGAEGEQTPSVSGEPVETEQERIRCLPTFFRWGYETSNPELQVPLLGDTASEEIVGEISGPRPVGRAHEVPLDDNEKVSCFSYLQRSKSADTSKGEDHAEIAKPLPVSTGHVHEVPLDEDEQVSCFSYLQRSKQEATDESSIPNLQAEIDAEAPHGIKQAEGIGEHGDELPDEDQESLIELLDGIGVSPQIETVEKKKCECLPFFSFRSESSFSVNHGTDASSSTTGFHPVEEPNKEGSLESLPASMPAFPWGKYSRYDLPSPSGVLSSQHEITCVIDRPEEVPTSLTPEPKTLQDSQEKRSCNCLPELLPAFSWGPIPIYTHTPIDKAESAGPEQHEESIADSRPASSTPEPRDLEDAEENRGSNCLPLLLPAFSWGPIPVYTHLPLGINESAEILHEGATAVSPTAAVTQEAQPLGNAEEKGACNCLPDLLPNFSWGPIPVYTHPPLDTYEYAGDGHYEEASAGSPNSSETREPQALADNVEKGSFNCLPELLPTFSWRSNPLNDLEIQSSSQDTTGRIHEVPLDENDEELVPSDVKAQSRESGTCACLPLLFPAFHWGITRAIFEKGLQEPLIPQDPPAAEPVRLHNASTNPSQTAEVPDPVVHGLEEGLVVLPAKPVAESPSVNNVGKWTPVTESEEFHIEGIASSRKTVTKGEPSENPADNANSVDVRQANYHFAVDVSNGHLTSTIENLAPNLVPLTIAIHNDAVSSTDSPYLSTGPSDGPGLAPGKSSPVVEGNLDDFKYLAQTIASHLAEEDVVASSDAVSQPVETLLRRTFPPEGRPKHELASCNCLPLSSPVISWRRPSTDNVVGEARAEELEENQDDMNLSTGETLSKLQNGQPYVDRAGERCNCLPSLPKFSLYDVFRDHHVSEVLPLPRTAVDDIRTPLLGRTLHKPDTAIEIHRTETTIAVEDATSAEAAAEAMATAQRQSPSEGDRTPSGYLKSVVHGGLNVTLVSLGVVASGAAADSKTITVVALGLANLVFGLFTHFGTIMSLYYNSRTQFQEDVGDGFIHGCVSLLSFLFFGALPPTTYGLAFRNSTNKNYKIGTTFVVALVSLVLLGAASASVKSKSAVRVITSLIFTAFLATIAGYETGKLIAQVLQQFGFSSV